MAGRLGAVVGGAALLLLAGAGGLLLVLTRSFPEPSWEDLDSEDAAHLYGSEGSALAGPGSPLPLVISPFHLAVDPMERLLLLNFEGDPDRIYLGFEPQAFDDAVHGQGLLVLGWRVDGRVDVFHSPGLRLDEATYGIAGGGLHAMEPRPFDGARFRLGPSGADLDLTFHDLEGRRIHLRILEGDPRPRRPIGLLAPMGDAATHPPALPLVFLHDFDFVREAGSEILVEIDGRRHAPDRLPVPMDGARVTFVRYSPDPFIVRWNPAHDGPLVPLQLHDSGGISSAEGDGVDYRLILNGGHPEIRSMHRSLGPHQVQVEFAPAFPNLAALREGVSVQGRFRILAHPTTGVVTGRWEVAREGGTVRVEAVPDGGWTPRETKRVVRLMYRVIPAFRAWPRSYRWQGTVQPSGGASGPGDSHPPPELHLRSAWERIPPSPSSPPLP